jgi:hypothetical protein
MTNLSITRPRLPAPLAPLFATLLATLLTILSAALLMATPALAFKELVIGSGGLPWTDIEDSSTSVLRQADSLWLWSTQSNENLGATLPARAGAVYSTGLEGEEGNERLVFTDLPEAAWAMDGDLSTAFNPDELGLPRSTELFIDLGGSFTIKQVRIFPRLDAAHSQLFPQAFELSFNTGAEPLRRRENILDLSFQTLLRFSTQLTFTNDQTRLARNTRTVVEWPGVRQVTGVRQARYLHFRTLEDSPWEIAEIEIITDGTSPEGFFVSTPILAASGNPIWGRVRTEGAEINDLPVVLQTRTGPDQDPQLFFIEISEGREIQVAKGAWQLIDQLGGGLLGATKQGPIRPNPAWSDWQTVADGIVRSPGPNQYIQFRLRLLQPGVRLKNLVFEFDNRPLANLRAEIWPIQVDAGIETSFSLVMDASLIETIQRADTGFRLIEVQTPAQITGIDSVRIDERPVIHTAETSPGEGFTVNLWERIVQDGTFIEIFFRGRVFIDGTGFSVRALDRRPAAEGTETAYQFAIAADVDPLTLGGQLSVRLNGPNLPLIDQEPPLRSVITPNGDGANDVFEIEYSLLKLTRQAAVAFEIFDLSGKRIRRGLSSDSAGRFARLWDGTDASGHKVPPGLYLFSLEVEADVGSVFRQGVVNVVY